MAKGTGGGGGPVGGGRVPPSAATGSPAERGAAALDDKIRALEKELTNTKRRLARRPGPNTDFEKRAALRDRQATLEAKLEPLLHQRVVERNF